jgi:hypothetical protein
MSPGNVQVTEVRERPDPPGGKHPINGAGITIDSFVYTGRQGRICFLGLRFKARFRESTNVSVPGRLHIRLADFTSGGCRPQKRTPNVLGNLRIGDWGETAGAPGGFRLFPECSDCDYGGGK